MTASMKAVVYYAPQDVRIESIPVPACGDDEIRIRVDACAVCGTDLKSYRQGNPRIKAPLVMGHEFTGLVETVGKNTEGFYLDERVIMATSISCGQCYFCHKDRPNLCINIAPMGFSYPGGMAEFLTIPARALQNGHLVRVPKKVKAEYAALAEPLSCAINAAQNCGIGDGDTVAVIGAGPMGIINACVAREFGAKKIILVGVSGRRLKQAEDFGFDVLVNSEEQDLTEIIMDETKDLGADTVIVTAPAVRPQEQALDLVRKHGTVCLFASLPVGQNMLTLDSRKIHYGELRVVGTSDSTPAQVRKSIELLSNGRIPADKLITHSLSMAEVFKAFDLMQNGEALKIVLRP